MALVLGYFMVEKRCVKPLTKKNHEFELVKRLQQL